MRKTSQEVYKPLQAPGQQLFTAAGATLLTHPDTCHFIKETAVLAAALLFYSLGPCVCAAHSSSSIFNSRLWKASVLMGLLLLPTLPGLLLMPLGPEMLLCLLTEEKLLLLLVVGPLEVLLVRRAMLSSCTSQAAKLS